MKGIHVVLTVSVVLVLLITACSPQATPTAAPPTAMPATQAPAATQPPAATSAGVQGSTVALGQNGTLGSILVDDKGMTLYLLTKDSPGTSTCYDKCATNWPPLLTTGAPVAGNGVEASKLGTITRTDGSTQVTYNGWPLYHYAKDQAAGDANGENFGNVWYVVSPAGDKVAKSGY